MKPKILIFCEGVTDQIFIADCLETFYNIPTVRQDIKKNDKKIDIEFTYKGFNGQIREIGGCSKLSNPIHLDAMKDNLLMGGVNIVIFDADYTGQQNGNKGFNACKAKLDNLQTKSSQAEEIVAFDYYIWPTNDNTDGVIENLLEKLIPDNKKPILDCISSHQLCLQSLKIDGLEIADLKKTIGYYLFTCKEKSEPRSRNYKREDLWNLDYQKNDDLDKFKQFLDKTMVQFT